VIRAALLTAKVRALRIPEMLKRPR